MFLLPLDHSGGKCFCQYRQNAINRAGNMLCQINKGVGWARSDWWMVLCQHAAAWETMYLFILSNVPGQIPVHLQKHHGNSNFLLMLYDCRLVHWSVAKCFLFCFWFWKNKSWKYSGWLWKRKKNTARTISLPQDIWFCLWVWWRCQSICPTLNQMSPVLLARFMWSYWWIIMSS